ncbi:hypothetical protein OFAG_02198 [Oxalobacter formigenes HOxBLS]|uniref:Uncharacterized protein n=1 Tax=Oxalobacter paraformigenes TaxID=556268 RepID=T5LQM4_9BURK|nr:hypothetical protein OFAG_02198 [Oxalobacter paraformigenes]
MAHAPAYERQKHFAGDFGNETGPAINAGLTGRRIRLTISGRIWRFCRQTTGSGVRLG